MEDGWKKPLFLLNWMEKYNNKVMTKLDAIENMFGTAGEADVAPTDIKSGKKAYNGTTLVTGTMPSNTAEQKLLSCGQSYSIPEGYHDGTGMVSADTLANQTAGTAAAGDVLISKTAYVNGSKVTGTMPEQGAKSKELACGEAYTIPAGHHNGQGKVTAKSLASQTGATAVATKLLAGLTAWVNGNKITGTMANKAGTTVKAAAVTQDDDNTYFAIPAAGYYDTAAKVYTENSNLGNKPTLLWTNPNPTTAIKNPTTIDIEATKYNAVIVKYYNRIDGDARDIYYKTIYKNTIIPGTQFIFTYGSSTVRNLELTDNALKIIGSNYPNNTKYAIPVEIYGFNTDTNFIQ